MPLEMQKAQFHSGAKLRRVDCFLMSEVGEPQRTLNPSDPYMHSSQELIPFLVEESRARNLRVLANED